MLANSLGGSKLAALPVGEPETMTVEQLRKELAARLGRAPEALSLMAPGGSLLAQDDGSRTVAAALV